MTDMLNLSRELGRWTGFRLTRLELRNFGGYHAGTDPDAVTEFAFDNGSAVFSGEVGAGKSTAIDAFRLLIRPRPHFNSATEAGSRDRSVRSYALGHFANEHGRGDTPFRLRNPDDPEQAMAILAVFSAADGRCFTVARLYMAKGATDGEWRNMTFPDQDVSLRRNLRGWDTQGKIGRLAQTFGGELHGTQDDYFSAFGRLLGLDSDRRDIAFTLLETAISAQRMGGIDDFARRFLLPVFDFDAKADRVRRIAKETGAAQARIGRLRQIVDGAEKVIEQIAGLEKIEADQARLRARQSIIPLAATYAEHHGAALEAAKAEERLQLKIAEISKIDDDLDAARRDLAVVSQTISEQDGGRLERMRLEVSRLERDRLARASLAEDIASHLDKIGLKAPADPGVWDALPGRIKALSEGFARDRDAVGRERDDLIKASGPLESRRVEIDAEIESLERNRSVIDDRNIRARDAIAAEAGLSSEEMPFLGELLRVRPGDEDWSEAVHRAIGGAALDILVAPEHYARATQIQANGTWGCRVSISCERSQPASVGADPLWRRIEVRSDSPLHDQALARIMGLARHDCVEDRHYGAAKGWAATRGGALKSGDRSVKDDGPRGRSFIGWSVEARREHLIAERAEILREIDAISEKRRQADEGLRLHEARGRTCAVVTAKLVPHADIDTSGIDLEVVRLREAIASLETGKLRELNTRKAQLEAEIASLDTSRLKAGEAKGGLERTRDAFAKQAEKSRKTIRETFDGRAASRALLRETITRAARNGDIALGRCRAMAMEIGRRRVLSEGGDPWERLKLEETTLLESSQRKLTEAKGRLQRGVGAFFGQFPELRSANLPDDVVESGPEARDRRDAWTRFRDVKRGTELLSLEEDFRQDANRRWGEAVQELKKALMLYDAQIRRMNQEINGILRNVAYDPARGSRAQISITESRSSLLRQFRNALEAALEEAAGDEIGDSVREVMAFIEESDLKAREEQRLFLTDLRNHYHTEVAEHLLVDGNLGPLVNVHASAGGSSGGQGERLTLLLLGAALSYAFGQRDPDRADRSLGLIMLDEAFLKSSPEAASGAAEVLRALDLQIIIATPFNHVGVMAGHAKRIFNVVKHGEQAHVCETRLRDISRAAP